MAKRSIIPIFIPHLGCPNRCTFCDQRKIAAEGEPSPTEVAQSIRGALQRCGTPAEVAFYGGSFTAIERHKRNAYLECVQPFLKSGELSEIRVSTHPASVDDAVLDELHRYGVRTVELGAQSMEPQVLARANRGHTPDDTIRASRLVRSHGFNLVLQMMVGLPGETSPMMTARKLLALHPDAVRIYPVVVVRGTELERLWRCGGYHPLTPQSAAKLCAQPFALFEKAGVPVIRMGLNPTEELAGEVVAGAYHPALGEMVRSEILLKNARALLLSTDMQSVNIILCVAQGRVSQMTGQHRSNIDDLKREFNLQSVDIIESDRLQGYTVEIRERWRENSRYLD